LQDKEYQRKILMIERQLALLEMLETKVDSCTVEHEGVKCALTDVKLEHTLLDTELKTELRKIQEDFKKFVTEKEKKGSMNLPPKTPGKKVSPPKRPPPSPPLSPPPPPPPPTRLPLPLKMDSPIPPPPPYPSTSTNLTPAMKIGSPEGVNLDKLALPNVRGRIKSNNSKMLALEKKTQEHDSTFQEMSEEIKQIKLACFRFAEECKKLSNNQHSFEQKYPQLATQCKYSNKAVVFITGGGDCYHHWGCQFASFSSSPVTVDKVSRYWPCKSCGGKPDIFPLDKIVEKFENL